jgi:rare lipoprotein A
MWMGLPNRLLRRPAILLLLAALLLTLASCRKKPKLAAPAAPGAVEVGVASWYGHPYHGRAAASGEIYDMEKLTAAHRTLPFGAVVRVRNLANGRSVDVRINDRGPFVDGRIIDLSRAAARRIDMIGPGTAKVRLELLAVPAASGPELYAVQVGAFRDRRNAERLAARLRERFGSAQLVRRDASPPLWRVLVGRESGAGLAAALAERLRGEFDQAFVVRLDGPAR